MCDVLVELSALIFTTRTIGDGPSVASRCTSDAYAQRDATASRAPKNYGMGVVQLPDIRSTASVVPCRMRCMGCLVASSCDHLLLGRCTELYTWTAWHSGLAAT